MWDVTDEYIRSGHRDPSDFQPDTFRTITLDEERGIKAIVAKPKGSDKMEIQSYLFSKSKGWTLEKAKEWFEAHKSEAVDQQSEENPSTPAQSAEAQASSPNQSTESGSKPSQAKAESFRWAEGIFKPIRYAVEEGGGKIWRARVLHAGTTRNNVKFTRDELIRAARSLSLRPVNINHPSLGLSAKARWLPYPQNMVLRAEFEDDAIEALLLISDPEVNKMIEEGEINAVSVEWTALKEQLTDGVKPEGVIFPALALLTKDTPPGDPLASIIKEGSESTTKAEAVWSREYTNDLPDEAFAVILPGGKKDEQGKTTPRSLRKFPHHNKAVKSGDEHETVDLPHLRNALARLPQSKIPQKYKDHAKEHLEKHAKALKIGEHREGAEQLLEETVEYILIDHEERISELEERVEKLEAQRVGEGVALIQEAKAEEKVTDVRRPADRILYEKWIRAAQGTQP